MLVIDSEGQQLGVKSLFEALQIAETANLDLVEVSPTHKPPIAKILDYGKYCYELEKKRKGNKQPTNEIKEVRLSMKIDDHDWQVKMKKAKEFIEKSGKIKVLMKLVGREMLFKDKAMAKMDEFRVALDAQYDGEVQRFGNRFIVLLKTGKK